MVGGKEVVMDKQHPKYTSVRVAENFAVVRPAIAKQLNEQNLEFMVVDLGAIDWISSPGIGALVDAHQRFARRGGHVLLARVDKRIHNLLIITKLSLVFETFGNVEDAIVAGGRKTGKLPQTPQH
jgi:anti-anti-sigma factor